MFKFTIKFNFIVSVLLTVFALKHHTDAKKVTMVPLTAQKVYQLLSRNHNLDAVPEGRVVTQGIAAVTGFTLGLTKAMGAVFLYDVITANITEDTTDQKASKPLYVTQEMCFGSRIARSLVDAEAIAEAYSRLEESHYTSQPAVRKSQNKRLTKPKRNRRKKLKIKPIKSTNDKKITATFNQQPTTSAAGFTAAMTDVGTQTTQPTAANEAETINGATNTETTSSTTTSSDNDQPITCIVFQKPKN